MKRKILWVLAVFACLTCAFALIGCTGGENGSTGGRENGSAQTEPVEGKYFIWQDGKVWTESYFELKSGGEVTMEHGYDDPRQSIYYGTYTISGDNIEITIAKDYHHNLLEQPKVISGTLNDGVMYLYFDYDGNPEHGMYSYFVKEGKTPPQEQSETLEGKYFYWENGAATAKFIELKSGGEVVMDHIFDGAYGSIFYGTYTCTGENFSMTITRGNLGNFPDGESNAVTGTVNDGVMYLYFDYDGNPEHGVYAYFAKEGKTPPSEANPGEHPGDDPGVAPTAGKYYACIGGKLNLSYYVELKEDFSLTSVNDGQSVLGSYRLDGERITLIETVDGTERFYETTLIKGSMTVKGVTFYKQDATPPYRAEAETYYFWENGVRNKEKYIELGEYGYASMETVFNTGGVATEKTGTFVISTGDINVSIEMTLGQNMTISGTLSDGIIVLNFNGAKMYFAKEGKTPTSEEQEENPDTTLESIEGKYFYWEDGVMTKLTFIELKTDGEAVLNQVYDDLPGLLLYGTYTITGENVSISFTRGYFGEEPVVDEPLTNTGTIKDGIMCLSKDGDTEKTYFAKEEKVPPTIGDQPGIDNPPVEIARTAVPGRYYWWNEGKSEPLVYWDLKEDMTLEAHNIEGVFTGSYSLDGIYIICTIIAFNGAPITDSSYCPLGTVFDGVLYFSSDFMYLKEGITPPAA